MIFDVIDGSFGKGVGSFSGGSFRLPKPSGWGSLTVSGAKVTDAELASEENVKRLAGTLGWGAVGGLVLGPVGLLAGLLLGGKKNRCGFIVSFDDGRAFLATADHKTWLAIKGAALASHAVRKQPKTKIEAAPPPMPSIDNPMGRIEWILSTKGWQFRQVPKEGAKRFTIFQASKDSHSLMLAFLPDLLTHYALDQITLAFERLGDATHKIIVSESTGRAAEQHAKQLNIDLTELISLENVIPS